jgi:hypothetical protein
MKDINAMTDDEISKENQRYELEKNRREEDERYLKDKKRKIYKKIGLLMAILTLAFATYYFKYGYGVEVINFFEEIKK